MTRRLSFHWLLHQGVGEGATLFPGLLHFTLDLYLKMLSVKQSMKDHHLPKKLLYSQLFQGKCSQRGQKKCFKDTLKVSMKSFGVTPNCLEYLARDRDKWGEVVKRGVKVCEERRNAATELHRKLRKGTATSFTAATIPYPHYRRLFQA